MGGVADHGPEFTSAGAVSRGMDGRCHIAAGGRQATVVVVVAAGAAGTVGASVGAVWPGTVGGSTEATMSRGGMARICPAKMSSALVSPLSCMIAATGIETVIVSW